MAHDYGHAEPLATRGTGTATAAHARATRGKVIRGVLWDALRMAGPGLLVGGLLAAGTAAAMRSMLLGLSPVDPVSFLAAGVLLLCVVVTSSLGPALRASGIHPMEALRSG